MKQENCVLTAVRKYGIQISMEILSLVCLKIMRIADIVLVLAVFPLIKGGMPNEK